MTQKSKLSSPVYRFPMSDDELIITGRITLMWAQIDTMIDMILMFLYGMGLKHFDHIFGRKLVGQKIDSILAAIDRAPSLESQEQLKEMIKAIKSSIRDRNVLTHGFCGWEWKAKEAIWMSMIFSRTKNATFYSCNLPDLHERVAEACAKADVALQSIINSSEISESRNRPFVITSGEDIRMLPALPQGFDR